MLAETSSNSWLDRPLIKDNASFKVETLIIILILALTIFSRFAMLGERVMSHDEVNHVWPSYDYFKGKGYAHNPVTHGPFQFHIVALSYFLFGDNDFTSRIPAALFSSAAVAFVLFGYRRYLGRNGALIAAVLFLISPYMLFYGRYTRNEGFIELYLVLMLYAVLRHLDRGDHFSLYLLTGTIVMHFCTKETSYIYMAALLIFLMLIFLKELQRAERTHPRSFRRFVLLIGGAMLLVFLAIGLGVVNAKPEAAADAAAATTAVAAGGLTSGTRIAIELVAVVGALALAGTAFYFMIRELGWQELRRMRTFNLLMITGTFVLPQLAAFPVKILGGDPLDYNSSVGLISNAASLLVLLGASIAIGLLWNPRLWLKNAFLFYTIFIFLYTSMFTNGDGFFSGIFGSLGYWLSQQGEQRGTQPLYYYALVQIPVYEYLALLGSFLALYFGLRYDRFSHLPGLNPAAPQGDSLIDAEETDESKPDQPEAAFNLDAFYTKAQPLPVLSLLLFWSVISLIAYSLAGERMPWLTVHIAMPMLLAAGWGLGFLVDTTHWRSLANRSGVIALLLLPVFFTALTTGLGSLLGANPPFAGNTLDQLRATSRFVFAALGTLGAGAGILYLLRGWQANQLVRLGTLTVFAILAVLTARTAYRASYINYDHATEFLVYAHAARGPKDILAQVEEISQRTGEGKTISVAYSGDGMYPYQWYFRDYTNTRFFGNTPTRDLRDVPIILAGDDVYGKMEPIVGENFIEYNYMRLWWPMEDYKNLTWERIRTAFGDAKYRQALWDIWLNRDYKLYASLTNSPNLTLENWQPSNRIRMFVRKDLVSKIWNYGVQASVVSEPQVDPYEANMSMILPDRPAFGITGSEPGQFSAPRGIAIGPDNTLYVADSRNHRIQRFSPAGELLNQWGSFADAATGDAPGGTFNEPWDVAVAPDGTVFVSDTWNHRIQVFNAEGEFLRSWGKFGQAETPDAFWGPRGLAIDSRGRIYIADTGNKRIAIFAPDGTFIAQFGSAGLDQGQFDEPTGVAVGPDDVVYVADTWNQRVQVFVGDTDGLFFTPVREWPIE
ncbi:MAG: TIGR03663 family protein, partial [Anaerolineae bacterium]|nr:TIGR03663 family protein [Anaerolineae bacterium]